ncbi:unnamed protein product [Miscanthus lutarioriparius]|uniref:Uncharacterized protein n=1 Tax=Miscanthus lutarioriparius TaxID=422564 RepID=A0A811R667_9POAL|nr:unnamed protein product [Miscanthus lutarioriparius]
MDPPDLIPPRHFCPPIVDEKGGCDPNDWRNFGCRHGRVLLYSLKEKEIVVWDPPTGDHRRVADPPELDNGERTIWNGAVLCAAASDHSHVHGGFCSCPFKVAVVVVTRSNDTQFTKLWKTNMISNNHPYASVDDSGLYAEMDKEELIEGVDTMLKVAESLLAARRRTEGGAKQLTDEER